MRYGEAGASSGPSASLPHGMAQVLADSLKSDNPEAYAATRIPTHPPEPPPPPPRGAGRQPPPPTTTQPAGFPDPMEGGTVDQPMAAPLGSWLSEDRATSPPMDALEMIHTLAAHPSAGPTLQWLARLATVLRHGA